MHVRTSMPRRLEQRRQITVADILALLADFGYTADCDADLNGDGATNVNDILQILVHLATAADAQMMHGAAVNFAFSRSLQPFCF